MTQGEAHIKEKRCPAGVCKALLSYVIDRDKCRGCTLCARTCPAGAIVGSVKNPHVIDLNKCIKCQSEKMLKNLKEIAEFEGYMDGAKEEFAALETKLTHNLDH